MAARRAYHHGDLPRAARAEAVRLLAAGATDFTLPAVARALRVSHAALYRHFEGRRGLLAAIAADAYVSFGEALRARTAGLVGEALLAETLATYLEYARRNPGEFRALFHPELLDKRDLPDLERVAKARLAALADIVLRAGLPKRPESAALVWSSIHGLTVLVLDGWLPGRSDLPASAVDGLPAALARALLSGLGSVPEPGRRSPGGARRDRRPRERRRTERTRERGVDSRRRRR